jgi:hypothetical protein
LCSPCYHSWKLVCIQTILKWNRADVKSDSRFRLLCAISLKNIQLNKRNYL